MNQGSAAFLHSKMRPEGSQSNVLAQAACGFVTLSCFACMAECSLRTMASHRWSRAAPLPMPCARPYCWLQAALAASSQKGFQLPHARSQSLHQHQNSPAWQCSCCFCMANLDCKQLQTLLKTSHRGDCKGALAANIKRSPIESCCSPQRQVDFYQHKARELMILCIISGTLLWISSLLVSLKHSNAIKLLIAGGNCWGVPYTLTTCAHHATECAELAAESNFWQSDGVQV